MRNKWQAISTCHLEPPVAFLSEGLLYLFPIHRSNSIAAPMLSRGNFDLRRTDGWHLFCSHASGQYFVITALFPFIRAASARMQFEPIDLFSDAIIAWLSMIFVVSIVAWTFFFFFLNSARLELELESAH